MIVCTLSARRVFNCARTSPIKNLTLPIDITTF